MFCLFFCQFFFAYLLPIFRISAFFYSVDGQGFCNLRGLFFLDGPSNGSNPQAPTLRPQISLREEENPRTKIHPTWRKFI